MSQIKKLPDKKATGLYVDRELYDKIDALATKHDISFSEASRQLLRIGLETIDAQEGSK